MKSRKICNRQHILLVYPKPVNMVVSNDATFPFPIQNLTQIAAQISPEYSIEIADERVKRLTGNERADLVLITTLTFNAFRAYALSDRFRKRGIPTVIGGIHASVLPDEARRHASAVVVGEAEGIVASVLNDFRQGNLKSVYYSKRSKDLDSMVVPRMDLLNWRHRIFLSSIETSRGCPHTCDFCAAPFIAGKKVRFKSLANIDRELRQLKKLRARHLFIVDDNFLIHKQRAQSVIDLFRRHHFRWMAFANLSISEDGTFLESLRKNGCQSLFIGMESINSNVPIAKNRACSGKDRMKAAIERIHAHDIGIQGSFVFGFDEDQVDIFQETVSFIQDTGIDLPNITILTPFPGTRLFEQFSREGRLIHQDWSRYDMNHIVYEPKGITGQDVQQGYAWALKFLASPSSILSRLKKRRHVSPYFFMANFALHRSQTRLAHSLWNKKVQESFRERHLCPC